MYVITLVENKAGINCAMLKNIYNDETSACADESRTDETCLQAFYENLKNLSQTCIYLFNRKTT